MPLTVEQILSGCRTGRMQSVGHMSVIPLLDGGEAQDPTFGPPDFVAGTSGYGSIRAKNRNTDRPTIMPTGAAYLTPQAAQDHALKSAALVKAGEEKIHPGYCVQQGQGGLMPFEEREFCLMPAGLRAEALANRGGAYNAMWESITQLRTALGDGGAGNLVDLLKRHETELDQFVAEFEKLEGQIGAIILIDDKVVGIERAPNVEYFDRLWKPLIRECYGTLALQYAKRKKALPASRAPLQVGTKSLDGLRAALMEARSVTEKLVSNLRTALSSKLLSDQPEGPKLGKAQVLTVASPEYAGQVVINQDRPVYASIALAAV